MSKQQKKGISWTFLSTFIGAIVQTLQFAFTVRYLSTSEVGILAIVNVLLAIANMLKNFGLSSFLIHKQEITHQQQSSLFWLTMLIGAGIATLVAIIAPFASSYYVMPELESLLYLSALNVLIIASCSQWQALMVKSFRFIGLAKIELIIKCSGLFTTLAFLELGYGVYSPVFAMLIINVFNLMLLFFANRHQFIPSLTWDNSISRQAFSYGMFQVGGQFLNQLRANLDTLLIGKVLGADSVGLYSMAKELILRPARLIQPVVSRFALPNFATKQNDPHQQGKLYLQTTTVLITINGIIYTSLLLLAQPITHILYGETLSEQVAIYLQILALFGFIRCLGSPMGAIAQANGRTDVEFRWNLISTLIFAIIIGTSVNYGLLVTTIAMSLGQLFTSHLSYFLFLRPVCTVPFKQFLSLSLPTSLVLIIQMLTLNYMYLDMMTYIFAALALYGLLFFVNKKPFMTTLKMMMK